MRLSDPRKYYTLTNNMLCQLPENGNELDYDAVMEAGSVALKNEDYSEAARHFERLTKVRACD